MAFNKKLTLEGLQYYHSKIKTLFTNVNQSISNETSRATAKENEIASNLSSHTSNTSNPHSVTKEQVGLGNVENKSSATIRGEITKSNVTTSLGYTPYTPNEIDNKFSALETNLSNKQDLLIDSVTGTKAKITLENGLMCIREI